MSPENLYPTSEDSSTSLRKLRKNYDRFVGGGAARVIPTCMDPIKSPIVQTVLILKADRFYAEALRQEVMRTLPNAQVTLTHSIEAAKAVIDTTSVDLFVSGIGASLESDVLELVARSENQPRSVSHVLIVTARREFRVLSALRSMSVDGVFDTTTEEPRALATAIDTVISGRRFWSKSILEYMHEVGSASTAIFRFLTGFEQVVLSVIGDGCDNVVAASKLQLSPSTVSTVRRELHRKLGVQHRGELVRVAAQHGFVRFTPLGIVRPGFAMLRAAYEARRAKRNGGFEKGGC